MNIEMDWKGGFKFNGKTLYGHEISTDASKKLGGREDGYQPIELVLFGLAGCTGIDIILITQKMRQEITDLKIKINAEQREESPRAISQANIEYIFKGRGLDQGKLEKAVTLSHEKYCSVSATMAGITRFAHKVTIAGEE